MSRDERPKPKLAWIELGNLCHMCLTPIDECENASCCVWCAGRNTHDITERRLEDLKLLVTEHTKAANRAKELHDAAKGSR